MIRSSVMGFQSIKSYTHLYHLYLYLLLWHCCLSVCGCMSVCQSLCMSVSLCMCVSQSAYVQLNPHVLSTPVIDDFNMDGITEELLVAINHYLDDQNDDDDGR